MFTELDVRAAGKVAVIGKTVADQLYPDGDAIGQIMRIKSVPFIVVGELIPKGLSVMGSDQDDVVIVPYTSAMKRLFGATNLRGITLQASTPGCAGQRASANPRPFAPAAPHHRGSR